MRIENIDQLIEQDILKQRVCKIKYSSAYENYLKQKLSLLYKTFNVFQMEDLFLADATPEKNSRLKSWGIGLLKNLLGIIPKYGITFTALFSISDTIYFLKTSDLEKLMEKLQLREKPYKKYKKIKNIIIVKNVAYLNAEEIDKIRVIQELIQKKYIINTLLIFCEPMDFASSIYVNQEAVYVVPLDNKVLHSTFHYTLNKDQIEILEILGIEYIEYVRNLETDLSANMDNLVKKIILDMLQKAGYEEEERLNDFLRLCSLLFDAFYYEDIEKIADLKNVCCEDEIKKSIDSKLIRRNIQNEYHFFINKVRQYYQNSACLYSDNIRNHILSYLKEKYPHRYTDLALAYILASDSTEEKVSICLKAIYFEQRKAPVYKIKEITHYLDGVDFDCIKAFIKLNDIYSLTLYSHSNVDNLCKQCFYGLNDLGFLTPEEKLICLSSVAKVSYEIMKPSFLLEIDTQYRNLFGKVCISRTYEKYISFILDYVVFSTSIEQSFETSQVVQRLLKYLQKSNISLQDKIRYSRLGNALFCNDPDKAMELTKQAYELSEDYLIEHKCATINYSCSLGICGEYGIAYDILQREFDGFFNTNIIDVSAENNFIIVSYLNKRQSIKWLVKKLLNLTEKIKIDTFSDSQIIYNNLFAALIEENRSINDEEIEKIFHKMQGNTNDTYHSFFLHQNRMTFYFLQNNYKQYKQERELYQVPGLLSSYKDFFKAKADFLEGNINQSWNIQQLQENLAIWGEIYPEKKYSLYKRPVLFGFIERWFE